MSGTATAEVANASSDWQWTKRVHAYDAVGRLVGSTYKQWLNNGTEPQGSSLEHCYAGSRHIQNYDGSNYGAVWHWAGAEDELAAPLRSPNPDTASQSAYNHANGFTPQRRSFISPATEGDKRQLYGQGRPEAKDSAGSGANWYLGTKSDRQVILQPDVESRLFFEGTVTATDMSRATDAREGLRAGIFGASNSYAGSSGRVVSESIGRDLNPLGRGDGMAYLGGQLRSGWLAPTLPLSAAISGSGNSVNNPHAIPIGGGSNSDPIFKCCDNNCCVGNSLCLTGVNGVGPLPEPCGVKCTAEECKSDPERCFRRCCEIIACGCGAASCRIVDQFGIGDNCHLFCRCGCGKYGGCMPSSSYCVKGQFLGGMNTCTSASGSGSLGCTNCSRAGLFTGSRYDCRAIVNGINSFLSDFLSESKVLPLFIKCCLHLLNDDYIRQCLSNGIANLASNSGTLPFACIGRGIYDREYPYDKPKGTCKPGSCKECCYFDNGMLDKGGCCPEPLGKCPPMICCENISSGKKTYPWATFPLPLECRVLSSYLHELVHYGGCLGHQDVPGSFAGWPDFIKCVCDLYWGVQK